MQLFSADATMFSNFFFYDHKKLKKTPQKVAHNRLRPFFFSAASTAQNCPELHFRFINSFIQSSLLRSLVITLQTFTIFQTLFSANKVKIQNDCMSDNHCRFNEFIKSQTTLYHIMIYSVRRFNERVTNKVSFWCFKLQIFKLVYTSY